MLRAPPAGFERVELVLLEVDPAVLLRLAFRTRASQLGFRATAEFRFDAPKGEFGVLYAAFDLSTAFAEAVLRTVPQDVAPGEEPLLTYEELARRRVVQLAAVPGGRPLRLVKLYDEGLAAAKVDNRIATDDDYVSSRRWAKAFHDHPAKVDGIAYLSRFMGSRRSVALFDRSAALIRRDRVTPLLTHPDFSRLVRDFQAGNQSAASTSSLLSANRVEQAQRVSLASGTSKKIPILDSLRLRCYLGRREELSWPTECSERTALQQ